ncbi:TPA: hypothetical protein ACHXUI_003837 [Shigella sonnei]|nr:hypothetical protein [Escherichia coli]MDD0671295.1 hypothetical protein [Shigella sonnei]
MLNVVLAGDFDCVRRS